MGLVGETTEGEKRAYRRNLEKITMPNEREKIILQLKGFDAAHYRRTELYARQIDRLCREASDEYASLAGTLFQPDTNKPFSFDDYPKTKKAASRIANDLARQIEGVVIRGTEAEWNAACDKNDAFLNSILKTSRLTPEEAEQYKARNLEALQGFQQRKVEGLGLSQRVWKYVGEVKDTIELGIDVGLGEGRSAAELSRDLRQCLQQPDKLFRRVRDKYGNLQLSKAAKLYHPGQGVYRSSAKNAQRLTRTEINMAYREAELLRWQQLDFVVGFRVQLSNNHTVLDSKGNPKPLKDICDELAGDYPKTFRFLGWHPQCRCLITPILSDYDEYKKDRGNRLKAIVRGEAYKSMPSRRQVTAMPENFTRYIESISERAQGWKSQPYYIRDNFKGGRIEGGLKAGVATSLKGNTSTGAKPAVKNNTKPCTEYDTEIDTLKRWAYAFGLDVSKLDGLRLAGNREALRAEVESLQALADKRQEEWLLAIAELQQVRNQISKLNKTTADKYTAICGANRCEAGKYYADCIKNLKEAKIQAEADLKKAIAEEAKKEYSSNMPEELKDGQAYLLGEKYVFSKEFFDKLKYMPTLKIPHTNKGSYESKLGREVVLDNDTRAKNSPWEKKAVVYHEFGHAIGDQRDIINGYKPLQDLREKQIARLRKKVKTTVTDYKYDFATGTYKTTTRQTSIMYAKQLSARIDAVYERLKKFGDDVFTRRGITKRDALEQIGSLQDTLKSLVNSSGVGCGHSTSYFNSLSMRRHEYLAHCFENTYLGNRAFEHFMPTEYKEMIDLIKSLPY